MKYTYEVIRVDEQARVMDVVYTHAVHGQMLIGVRLPFEGEDIEHVIRAFSPVSRWREMEMPVVVPGSGLSGEIDELPAPVFNPYEVKL